MTIFDIILVIIFLWAAYRGFCDGIIVQLGGIAGLLLGVYFAFRFGTLVGEWLKVDSEMSNVVGFIIVLALVLVVVAIISRALSAFFSVVGLSLLNKVGGVLLSVVKIGLVMGLLLYSFDYINKNAKWVDDETIERSMIYAPLLQTTEKVFPYIDFVKRRLLDQIPEESDDSIEQRSNLEV